LLVQGAAINAAAPHANTSMSGALVVVEPSRCMLAALVALTALTALQLLYTALNCALLTSVVVTI